MSEPSLPNSFDGTVRLFPLPNLVLFPHVMQPLHIFEPRYRQMTADALAGDHLIALALLQPGWEADYDGKPAIYPGVCVGQIVADQLLEDGRYNLLLRGVQRARVVEEFAAAGKTYRSARVELLEETAVAELKEAKALRRRLRESVGKWFAAQQGVLQQFTKLLDSDLPLGPLADVFAYALPLELPLKQRLLEETDVRVRVLALLGEGASLTEGEARKFPPDFSEN